MDKPDRDSLKKKIAPCSLMCHTCSAYCDGVIQEAAGQLSHYMDGVGEFYEKHTPDRVEYFNTFMDVLSHYSAGYCPGCRSKVNNN